MWDLLFLLEMGRTAYDFETHGLKDIRTYVRNFELPRLDAHSQNDWHFELGRRTAYMPTTNVNKSHQNFLEVRHEKWRYLETIRHLTFEAVSPLKCGAFSLDGGSNLTIMDMLGTNTMLPVSVDTKVAEFFDPRCTLPAVLPEMYPHAPIEIEK